MLSPALRRKHAVRLRTCSRRRCAESMAPGAKSLRLGTGGNGLRDRKVGKKAFDFRSAHFARMPLAMEQDESPNPMNVRLLGPIGVMFGSEGCSDLIEQFWRGDRRSCLGSGRWVSYVRIRGTQNMRTGVDMNACILQVPRLSSRIIQL